MKRTLRNAATQIPIFELGPRMLVPAELRGCRGCVHYTEGWCTADRTAKDPPFWVHVKDHPRQCEPDEGRSCAMWKFHAPLTN